jgi:hypothetical protein
METKYFPLGHDKPGTLLKVIRVLFGLVCIAIALFWMIFNIRAAGTDRTLWISVVFLSAFGMYQIWAGLGKAVRFISIGRDRITLKKSSLLTQKDILPSDIKKIEVYPLNLIFYLNNGGKTILRFGTTFTDIIDPVKSGIEEFAASNSILLESITEEI